MGKTDGLIKSVSRSRTEIPRGILSLHAPEGKIDCDATYGAGGFYRDGTVPKPELRFDVSPRDAETVRADCRNPPLAAKSRPVADWQARNQKNARKYRCYFRTFEKGGPKIRYL